MEERGRFWEGRIGLYMFKMGVYFWWEGGFHECRIYRCLKGGYIMGGSLGIF